VEGTEEFSNVQYVGRKPSDKKIWEAFI
jgi:hypothetical protein